MNLSIAITDKGLLREANEDKVFADDNHGVYAVADGVGSASEGAMASEIICRNLKIVLAAAPNDFGRLLSLVERSLIDADLAIRSYRDMKGYKEMASTVAVLVLDPKNPRHVAICHVGDSRVYRISHGMPEVLTRDHRLTKEDTLLLRAVGSGKELKTDWIEIDGEGPANYVLCTDGVHEVVSPARLAVYAAAPNLESAAERLKAEVLRRGAPDNFSFVIVKT